MATEREIAAMSKAIGDSVNRVMRSHESFLSNLYGEKVGARRTVTPTGGSGDAKVDAKSVRINVLLNKSMIETVKRFNQLNTVTKVKLKLSGQDKAATLELNKLKRETIQQEKDQIEALDALSTGLDDFQGAVDEAADGAEAFGKSFKDWRKWGGETLWKGMQQGFDEFQQSLSTGGISPVSTVVDALMMGMDTKDLIQMQATYRTDIMRSGGGIEKWTETLKASQLDLVGFTGSLEESNRASASMRSSLMAVGVSFDEATDVIGKGQSGMVGSFKTLTTVTGKTIREMSEMNAGMLAGDDSRELMMKMNKDQRRAYIENNAKTISQFTMLTSSLAKAEELVRAQNTNANKSFKDRFVESQKVQAAALRSGMSETDSRRLGELRRMTGGQLNSGGENVDGDSRRQELQKLEGTLSKTITDLQGSELYANQNLGDKLSRMAPNINIANTETYLETDPKVVAGYQKESLSAAVESNQHLTSLIATANITNKLATNSGVIMAAGFTAILLSILSSKAVGKFPGLSSNVTKAGTANVATKAGTAVATAFGSVKSMLSKGMGNITSVVKTGVSAAKSSPSIMKHGAKLAKATPAGLIAGVTSLAVDGLWTADSKSEQKQKDTLTGALDGAALGAMVGSIVPGIGTAIGAAIGGVLGGAYGFATSEFGPKSPSSSTMEGLTETMDKSTTNEDVKHKQNLDRLKEQRDMADANDTAETKRLELLTKAEESRHQRKLEQLKAGKKELYKISIIEEELNKQIPSSQREDLLAKKRESVIKIRDIESPGYKDRIDERDMNEARNLAKPQKLDDSYTSGGKSITKDQHKEKVVANGGHAARLITNPEEFGVDVNKIAGYSQTVAPIDTMSNLPTLPTHTDLGLDVSQLPSPADIGLNIDPSSINVDRPQIPTLSDLGIDHTQLSVLSNIGVNQPTLPTASEFMPNDVFKYEYNPTQSLAANFTPTVKSVNMPTRDKMELMSTSKSKTAVKSESSEKTVNESQIGVLIAKTEEGNELARQAAAHRLLQNKMAGEAYQLAVNSVGVPESRSGAFTGIDTGTQSING